MDAATLYKLIVLYMLSKVDFPLTNVQISTFFLEKEYTNYFSLQSAINSLIDSGFISMEVVRNTSYYNLTAEGEQTVEFFENKISNEIIDDVDLYLMANKYELRNEVGTISNYYRSSNNDYVVHCQVKEGKSTLISLEVSVPTKEAANAMCNNWKDASQEIYQTVMMKLMNESEVEEAENKN
jgi:DNA-binding PadR family transcriptional regulator